MRNEIKERLEKIEEGIVPEGYKKTNVGIIPEDWEVKKLEEILELKNGVNANKEDYGYGIKFINVLDILNNNYINYENIIGRVNINKKIIENNDVNYGDILFQRSSETVDEVGYANVYLDRKISTFGGFVIRGKKISEYEPSFLKELLNSSISRKQIESIAGGSTRFNIGQKDLYEVRLSLPSLQEQEKIANILSTWDKAIENIKKLIKEKETQKRGLMQELLTGQIRLPEFNGEWREVELGEVLRLQGGYAFKSDSYLKYDGIPIIRISNIQEGIDLDNNVAYYNDINIDDAFIVKNGDILIAMSGATTGKTAVYKSDKKAYLNQRVGKFISDNERLDNKYLIQIVNSKLFSDKMETRLVAGAQPNISGKDIETLNYIIPPLPEQKAIAEILSTADKEIELLNKLLENKKEEKKGLMQLLLTGIVRV